MENADTIASLESRVRELELRLDPPDGPAWVERKPWIVFCLTLVALGLSVPGIGLPNHPYQITIAGLIVALAYHREWFALARSEWKYIQPILNVFVIAVQSKLLIGGGMQRPFYWVNLPQPASAATSGQWFDFISKWSWQWQPTALASWEIDVTRMQSFLFVLTVAGAVFRFQPFASLTALILVLLSVSTFSQFQWDWVMPALVASVLCLYLQVPIRKDRA